MIFRRKPLFIACVNLVFAANFSLPVAAQDIKVEEIIVTAQKHEESLQETPIAITAFTSRDIETQRITGLMQLSNVPSINIAPFVGARGAPNLFMRGMGDTNSQSTNDLAIGIYMDGVPVGRGMGLATDIAELERIEVLRGPQGTLWGRNTTAGAINFIPKRPEPEFSGKIMLTAASFKERGGRATVNVPLADDIYARIGYMRSKNDGWVRNDSPLPNQINYNEDKKKEAMRVALRYDVTDKFTVDYSFDKSEMEYGNYFYQILNGIPPVHGRQKHANYPYGLTPSSIDVSGHNITLAWDTMLGTVKSTTAYRDLKSKNNMNFIGNFTQDRALDQRQVSQEIQLVGDVDSGVIRYVSGVFYIKEKADEMADTSLAGGLVHDHWSVDVEARSVAAYGQVTWTPPVLDNRLDLTFGLRYTEDKREAVKHYIEPYGAPHLVGVVVPAARKFDSTNGVLNLAYRFTDDVNGYIKYSTGYRAGGFNVQATPEYFPQGYDQEDVKAWEVGLKSELFDNRLRLNVAVFRSKYDDLQVNQKRNPIFFADTLNAGSSITKGVEIETVAQITENIRVNAYYTRLSADYGSYIDNGIDYASERHIPNSPKWQAGAGLQWDVVHTNFGNIVLNIDARAQDEFYSSPTTDAWNDGYSVWNARVELEEIPMPHGALRVAIWGRNLSNKKYTLATTNFGVNMLSAQFGEPRITGIDLIYEF